MDFTDFNPDVAHQYNGNFAALPHIGDEAGIVYLPVPWDATTSGMKGTANGPENILRHSLEIDLFDHRTPEAWCLGHQFLQIEESTSLLNMETRDIVQAYRKGHGDLLQIDQACERIHQEIYEKIDQWQADRRLIVLVGGEHSISYGSIRSHLERFPKMHVLQLDAHMDLRKAYEGIKFSHASIFYNVLNYLPLTGLYQLGVRDLCREEWALAERDDRVHFILAEDIYSQKARGISFHNQLGQFLNSISDEIYLSIDIDVLEPHYCPNTGTPVPGGLSFWDILQVVDAIHKLGKKIVGLDLVETGGTGYTDGFTAAKLLYLVASRVYRANWTTS